MLVCQRDQMELTDRVRNPDPWNAPPLFSATCKATCEDFVVEEVPTYTPTGDGEHLFLWLQKRDVSAGELQQILCRELKIHDRDLGIAGQKDKKALTFQWVSVPATCESRVEVFQHDRIQIHQTARHSNKLRTGHLIGNRFQIVLRATGPQATEPQATETERLVRQRLEKLAESGFPNYFGDQRFGRDGATLLAGTDFLTASNSQRKKRRLSRFQRKMFVSAVQSAIFNQVVNARVKAGTVGAPVDGDVVCRQGGIRPFLFSNRNSDEQERLIPMGPLFGPKMMQAEGEILESEQQVLSEMGLHPDHFDSVKLTPGARRPMLAWPENCEISLTDEGHLKLQFELKAGTYATVLLREIVDLVG